MQWHTFDVPKIWSNPVLKSYHIFSGEDQTDAAKDTGGKWLATSI
jgi:hypothetical protein